MLSAKPGCAKVHLSPSFIAICIASTKKGVAATCIGFEIFYIQKGFSLFASAFMLGIINEYSSGTLFHE